LAQPLVQYAQPHGVRKRIQAATLIEIQGAAKEKRTGVLWGIIVGCAALVVLLGAGYALIV